MDSLNSILFDGVVQGDALFAKDGSGCSFVVSAWNFKYDGEDCFREVVGPSVRIEVSGGELMGKVIKKARPGVVASVVGELHGSVGGPGVMADHFIVAEHIKFMSVGECGG
jgi:hypothetical protein